MNLAHWAIAFINANLPLNTQACFVNEGITEHILLFYPIYQFASSLDYQYKSTVFLKEGFWCSHKKGQKLC